MNDNSSHALGLMLKMRFHHVRCNRKIEKIMSKGFVRSIEKYYVKKAIEKRNEAVKRLAAEIPKPTEER